MFQAIAVTQPRPHAALTEHLKPLEMPAMGGDPAFAPIMQVHSSRLTAAQKERKTPRMGLRSPHEATAEVSRPFFAAHTEDASHVVTSRNRSR
ncbi:hypothetical protein [Sinorhizobium medicae]|uniref:hypothetical protein n=1 Tax=Sinorhizobium medicae TaxID=110321 RepID=UPI0013E2BB79|nr:hypothetical protein [Sinorhizobium medicae]MDX0602653.1 hypothetical protein [Sinorhizobium medicae]MDX0861894.1 hypothetical protein [Sinorhizobium medicae]